MKQSRTEPYRLDAPMSRRRQIFVAAVCVLIGIGLLGYLSSRYTIMQIGGTIMGPRKKLVLVDRFAYSGASPRRGDVVVYNAPISFMPPLAHSVVATPGDTFAIRNGIVFVNGSPTTRRYGNREYNLELRDHDIVVNGKTLGEWRVLSDSDWTSPSTVPRGCYIVLGDSDTFALDSASSGFLCPGRPGLLTLDTPTRLLGRVLAP